MRKFFFGMFLAIGLLTFAGGCLGSATARELPVPPEPAQVEQALRGVPGAIFPVGNYNAANKDHFTGPSYAAALAASTLDGYSRAEEARKTYAQMMGKQATGLEKTDPELDGLMKKYIYGDIARQAKLSSRDQHLITLAVLVTQQNQSLLGKNVQGALQDGVKPIEIRETLYQLAPYIGFGRVADAMETVNGVFRKNGVALPLPADGTTTDADRFEKGLAFQVGTYGERINQMRANTPEEQKHLQDDLSAFCFGDIYTRKTLDLKTREMITVAAIGTMGTGEPQFTSHVRGLLAAGATREEAIGVITVMNPYIGFPRTLNCLKNANGVFSGK